MFEVGPLYRRRDLHAAYGGQGQGGISTPASHPFLLLFTGESGEIYGYRDGWEPDGTFRYTGEGQVGDMTFVRGNAAIRDHAANGKDLHLFAIVPEVRGHVRYVGQMVCAGFDLVPNIPDREDHPRTAIVFRLIPIRVTDTGAEPTVRGHPSVPEGDNAPGGWYWSSPMHELRSAAIQAPPAGLGPREARQNVYHRSEAVRVYVQRRSNGRCEGCGASAPFKTPEGRPYLEPHHTRRLSDGGPDHPRWVVAVCPTCHRRAHYAEDAQAYNARLRATANRLEAA